MKNPANAKFIAENIVLAALSSLDEIRGTEILETDEFQLDSLPKFKRILYEAKESLKITSELSTVNFVNTSLRGLSFLDFSISGKENLKASPDALFSWMLRTVEYSSKKLNGFQKYAFYLIFIQFLDELRESRTIEIYSGESLKTFRCDLFCEILEKVAAISLRLETDLEQLNKVYLKCLFRYSSYGDDAIPSDDYPLREFISIILGAQNSPILSHQSKKLPFTVTLSFFEALDQGLNVGPEVAHSIFPCQSALEDPPKNPI